MLIASGQYTDAATGTLVAVTVRRSARRFSARWVDSGTLRVTVPAGTTDKSFARVMDSWWPQLLTSRPQARYHNGQQWTFDCFSVTIVEDDECRAHTGALRLKAVKRADSSYVITVPHGLVESAEQNIGLLMCRIAHIVARKVLIAEAWATADSLGVHPAAWSLSRGRRILGHCNARGEIALSSALMFMPADLRRYVIAHELAHLSHMDHSPAFHSLLDRYLDGREKALVRKLHAFAWPVPR